MTDIHLAAIAKILNTAGLAVYDTDVRRPDYNPINWPASWSASDKQAWTLSYPYVIVEHAPVGEVALSLSHAKRDVEGRVRVISVGLDAKQAGAVVRKVRSVLDGATPTVSGFAAWLRRLPNYSLPLGVDESVTIEGFGHPVVGLDTFRYLATPST